mmetsp:Transcript_15417/g.38681  ORF Transcript_15417/g.38681 Transcript_15417/m.38681 type:complete len:180 (+) Transcript_15417:232-771(+)
MTSYLGKRYPHALLGQSVLRTSGPLIPRGAGTREGNQWTISPCHFLTLRTALFITKRRAHERHERYVTSPTPQHLCATASAGQANTRVARIDAWNLQRSERSPGVVLARFPAARRPALRSTVRKLSVKLASSIRFSERRASLAVKYGAEQQGREHEERGYQSNTEEKQQVLGMLSLFVF